MLVEGLFSLPAEPWITGVMSRFEGQENWETAWAIFAQGKAMSRSSKEEEVLLLHSYSPAHLPRAFDVRSPKPVSSISSVLLAIGSLSPSLLLPLFLPLRTQET